MNNKKHKALIQDEIGKLSTKLVPTRKINDDEVLISIISVGICGTDLQILRKSRNDLAKLLGHEGIGIITKIGKNISQLALNQLVVFNPVNPNKQEEILGHSFEGIFQEKYIVNSKQIEWGLIQPLVIKLSTKVAPLIEPLGTVIYAQELVDQVCNQESVVIVGAGAIGLAHVFYAKNKGIKKIFLVNRSKEKLDWVVQHGVLKPEECLLDSQNLVKEILEKTSGCGVDSVYLCTPRGSAKKVLIKALQYVRQEGCIDLVGGFKDGDEISDIPSLDLNSIRRSNICGVPSPGFVKKITLKNKKNIYLTGHRGTSKEVLDKAIKLLAKKRAFFSKLITHVFTLDEAASFLNQYIDGSTISEKETQYIKGIINI